MNFHISRELNNDDKNHINNQLFKYNLGQFPEDLRGRCEIERIALDKKCDFIKVDTLSFQALDFYEKNGYQVFGSIDNVGRHFKHYYLKKDLNIY